MPKTRKRKSVKGGLSWSDIWAKLKQANNYLKEKKYAKNILGVLPGLRDVKYVGPALSAAESLGYGRRRVRK